MPPPVILNTRPEPQGARFTAELRAAFGGRVEVIAAPLMQAEFLAVQIPVDAFQALVLTSETGAIAAARLRETAALPDLVFCVGDRTAEVAIQAGSETVSAKGDAGELLRLILSRAEDPLLYLHGEDRAADLEAALAPHGRRVVSRVAYRQRALPLCNEAKAALRRGPVILPLFSPRSAQLFLAAAAGAAQSLVQPVVISENTRMILPGPLAMRALVAARPDGPSMMAAIARCIPPPAS